MKYIAKAKEGYWDSDFCKEKERAFSTIFEAKKYRGQLSFQGYDLCLIEATEDTYTLLLKADTLLLESAKLEGSHTPQILQAVKNLLYTVNSYYSNKIDRICIMVVLKQSLLNFFKTESAVGVLLILSTILALLFSNSPLSSLYKDFLDIPVIVSIHEFTIAKPLLLWVNDGLMAVFFFMVGMEIKREVLEGSLNHISKIALPAFAAVGGMIVPALIYMAFNVGDPIGMQGWAIPMATDIAFALGILSLLGKRVPAELKIFLLALAIIDDLGAIIVIALFFGHGLSLSALAVSGLFIAVLMVLNWRGVTNNTIYILLGMV